MKTMKFHMMELDSTGHKTLKLCLYVYSVMRYSNFKVREQCFFSLLQNSKKISKIRDQNIPILSEKCYNSGLQLTVTAVVMLPIYSFGNHSTAARFTAILAF